MENDPHEPSETLTVGKLIELLQSAAAQCPFGLETEVYVSDADTGWLMDLDENEAHRGDGAVEVGDQRITIAGAGYYRAG